MTVLQHGTQQEWLKHIAGDVDVTRQVSVCNAPLVQAHQCTHSLLAARRHMEGGRRPAEAQSIIFRFEDE